MANRTKLAEWVALEFHVAEAKRPTLRDLFAADADRVRRLTFHAPHVSIDCSKARLVDRTGVLLQALARATDVPGRRDQMFAGARINETEDRSVLHTALRLPEGASLVVDGVDIVPSVLAVRKRIAEVSNALRSGAWVGQSGERIRDVVHIGIGGSDLGPRLVCDALAPRTGAPLRVHFVSNVDGVAISNALANLDPARTLFVIASKTFTTQETLANARAAREWCTAGHRGDETAVAKHFVAVSTNRREVQQFGIDPQNMLPFWDWVGGRFSLWSAIGLPIACAIGADGFEDLLAGAYEMDRHFAEAPIDRNVPVLLALLHVWETTFLRVPTRAVLPYDERLRFLPAHLQQLMMESNGKRVNRAGEEISYATSPIVWGAQGTDAQHSFFQLLHQGTSPVACEFIGVLSPGAAVGDHHAMLLSNCFAQSAALMRGKTALEAQAELVARGLPVDRSKALAPHRTFPGDRASVTMLVDRIDPRSLGALLALYEHVTFVEGVLLDICSFDQWGVELGKQLAASLLPAFKTGVIPPDADRSTAALLHRTRP